MLTVVMKGGGHLLQARHARVIGVWSKLTSLAEGEGVIVLLALETAALSFLLLPQTLHLFLFLAPLPLGLLPPLLLGLRARLRLRQPEGK